MHGPDPMIAAPGPFAETLDGLEVLLGEARSGSRFALLEGPVGVGMGEVLRLLAARAPGFFLRVRAAPNHPLAPVEAMIQPLLEQQRHDAPDADLERALGCIQGCHPLWFQHEVASSGANWERLAERRASLFDAISRLFAGLHASAPPIIVIEALEHLDSQTAALLRSMLDQERLGIRAPGALFVGVAPDEESLALTSLRKLPALHRIRVRPLTVTELATYLAREDTAAAIHARTGGLVDRVNDLVGDVSREPKTPPAWTAAAMLARSPLVRGAVSNKEPGSGAELVERALETAGRLVARHAMEEAEQVLSSAAARLSSTPAPDEAILFTKLAELRRMLGDIDGAIAAAERSGDRLHLARLLSAAARTEEARLAFEQVRERGSSDERRAATTELARLAIWRADYGRAAELARAVLATNQDDEAAMEARNVLGNVAWAAGELETAEHLHRENLRAAEQAGRPHIATKALNNLAVVELGRGRHRDARASFARVLELSRVDGATRDRAIALENLAIVDRLEGRYADAIAHYQAAVRLLKPLGERLLLARAARNLAETYVTLGDARRGLALVKLAEGMKADVHSPELRAERLCVESEAYDIAGEPTVARQLAEEARTIARTNCSRRIEVEATLWLAALEEREGERARAAATLDGLGRLTRVRDRARLALVRARLARGSGDEIRAALHAVELAVEGGEQTLELDARTEYARLLLHAGLHEEAVSACARARDLATKIGEHVPDELRECWRARPASIRLGSLEADLRARRVDRDPSTSSGAFDRIAGHSPPIVRLKTLLERVASAATSVLLLGESGTGKELVAQAVHELSGRRGRFVRVNCGALVESMRESELFGHERGAFTGAERQRPGYFELAQGGTLLLDEIGEAPASIQVALLRVLQERTFHRVGGTNPIEVDVRIVAATNRDLEAMVEDGSFRRDLYYRLRGMALRVPPLRERLSDLRVLVDALLAPIRREEGLARLEIDPSALECLAQHSWPGNVRELASVLHTVAVLSGRSVIREADLREHGFMKQPTAAPASPLSLTEHYWQELCARGSVYDLRRELERAAVARAFEEAGGNISKAAARLGMKRPRLSSLVREQGLKEGRK